MNHAPEPAIPMTPSYHALYSSGKLESITASIESRMSRCSLCPHRCGADRRTSASGRCRSGMFPVVSAIHPHFGEERCLVGRKGSGAIFMTNCNLSCIFCQNYDISHLGRGQELSYRDLAGAMITLQSRGCHNINLVSPTHMIYAILKSLLIAIPEGLSVPLVYNSGGYDATDVLNEIEGVFDIYMPDFKYMDPDIGEMLSGAKDYPSAAMEALREMHRQVGDLILDRHGIALSGLLVRHLVLPNNIAATDRVISFIAGVSKNMYINIMDQYRPEYRAYECAEIKRRVTLQEFDDAIVLARNAGLTRIDGAGGYLM
jgi:putative pyruvate formate lyase activating enzyme